MKKWLPLSTLTLLFFLCSSSAAAFQCGHEIVSEKSQLGEVLAQCGEPFSARQFVDFRLVGYPAVVSNNPEYRRVGLIGIPVQVEEWIYNYGSTQLMRRLRFENGQLMKIETLGYGN